MDIGKTIAHMVVEKLQKLEPEHPEVGMLVNFAVDSCKERDLYKKAFELACNALDNKVCSLETDCREDGKCPDCIRDYFLKKAGEENE